MSLAGELVLYTKSTGSLPMVLAIERPEELGMLTVMVVCGRGSSGG